MAKETATTAKSKEAEGLNPPGEIPPTQENGPVAPTTTNNGAVNDEKSQMPDGADTPGKSAKTENLPATTVHNNDAVTVKDPKPVANKDLYAPVGIKVLRFLKKVGEEYAIADKGTDILKGYIVTLIRPSDYHNEIKYTHGFYNRDLGERTTIGNGILIQDANKKEYSFTDTDTLDTNLLYFFVEPGNLSINVDTFQKYYLVNAKRSKPGGKESDWGTQLHTEFMVYGSGSIFDENVDISYSSKDDVLGLKDGKTFKIRYSKILSQTLGKNLPKRIISDSPTSSLLGLSVTVEKLKYVKRNQNFSLAIRATATDISMGTDKEKVECYEKIWETTVEKGDIKLIKKDHLDAMEEMKNKGIKLFDGIYIKEVGFAIEVTDEDPGK